MKTNNKILHSPNLLCLPGLYYGRREESGPFATHWRSWAILRAIPRSGPHERSKISARSAMRIMRDPAVNGVRDIAHKAPEGEHNERLGAH